MTPRRAGGRLRGEEGFATVLAAAATVALLAVALLVVELGAATAARHRAQAAADLAALAAAADVLDPVAACGAADRIAVANGARPAGCVVDDLQVRVAVTVDVGLGVWGARTARAQARAGPVTQ